MDITESPESAFVDVLDVGVFDPELQDSKIVDSRTDTNSKFFIFLMFGNWKTAQNDHLYMKDRITIQTYIYFMLFNQKCRTLKEGVFFAKEYFFV